MDVIGTTGWERVTPHDDHPGLTCEIKRLSLLERMELSDRLEDEKDGKIKIKFTGQSGRDVFGEFVRKISGLKFNGKEMQPADILGPDMPPDDGVVEFMILCVAKFWDMNFVSEEERKNFSEPSDTNGQEGGDPTAETQE